MRMILKVKEKIKDAHPVLPDAKASGVKAAVQAFAAVNPDASKKL